ADYLEDAAGGHHQDGQDEDYVEIPPPDRLQDGGARHGADALQVLHQLNSLPTAARKYSSRSSFRAAASSVFSATRRPWWIRRSRSAIPWSSPYMRSASRAVSHG